jgi:acyl-CoA synthetase (AMP-forming)/AMP-acid ligase II
VIWPRHPVEVEAFLYRHPAVADVQGVGVPDDHWGEEFCVWIKLAAIMAMIDELEGRAKERNNGGATDD